MKTTTPSSKPRDANTAATSNVPTTLRCSKTPATPKPPATNLPSALADALVISGSEQQVADRIAEMPSFGADEIIADFVLLPDNPQAAVERTRKLLGELADSD